MNIVVEGKIGKSRFQFLDDYVSFTVAKNILGRSRNRSFSLSFPKKKSIRVTSIALDGVQAMRGKILNAKMNETPWWLHRLYNVINYLKKYGLFYANFIAISKSCMDHLAIQFKNWIFGHIRRDIDWESTICVCACVRARIDSTLFFICMYCENWSEWLISKCTNLFHPKMFTSILMHLFYNWEIRICNFK